MENGLRSGRWSRRRLTIPAPAIQHVLQCSAETVTFCTDCTRRPFRPRLIFIDSAASGDRSSAQVGHVADHPQLSDAQRHAISADMLRQFRGYGANTLGVPAGPCLQAALRPFRALRTGRHFRPARSAVAWLNYRSRCPALRIRRSHDASFWSVRQTSCPRLSALRFRTVSAFARNSMISRRFLRDIFGTVVTTTLTGGSVITDEGPCRISNRSSMFENVSSRNEVYSDACQILSPLSLYFPDV